MSFKFDIDYLSLDPNEQAAFLSHLTGGLFVGSVLNLPGIMYHGAIANLYISSTQIKYVQKTTALHYKKKYIDMEMPFAGTSAAFLLGSVVHALFLEPHKFSEEYFVFEACDLRTKEGKAKKAQAAIDANGKTLVDSEIHEQAKLMCESLQQNRWTKYYPSFHPEVSLFWKCPFTGLMMKARLDGLCDEHFLEVKSAQDISPSGFARAAYNLHYDLSLAHYQKGIEAVLNKTLGAYFLCVESSEPYASEVYRASDELFLTGHDKWIDSVTKIERGIKENKWPSYVDDRVEEPPLLLLPSWAAKKGEMLDGI
jgi:PDDEXK-like domain of unknown function (DUF3799)